MLNKQYVLDTMRKYGKQMAHDVQERSASMIGEELYGEKDFIPDFKAASEKMNMIKRSVGFVCRSTAGRVVRLLQKYDSTIYTQEPEELPALWGFVWSKNPADALPFVAISTAPYEVGDCCIEDGKTYRSTIANNVWSPSSYPAGWEEVSA